MSYDRVNWLNNISTPVNAINLNKMDAGIKDHDDKIANHDSQLADITNNVPLTIIDDTDTSIAYVNTWTQSSDVNYYNSTKSTSNVTNASSTKTFFGTGISIYDAPGPNRGIAEIFIDGVSQGTYDRYSATQLYEQLAFSITGLTRGSHTCEIVVTGTKNTLSTDYYFALDYLVIIDSVGNKIGSTVNNQKSIGVFVEMFPLIAPETDDSARINRAIQYAVANKIGSVILDGKIYYIGNTPIHLYNAINLFGQGSGKTIIKHTGTAQAILFQDTRDYYVRTSISDLTISGTGNNSSTAIGCEIQDVYGFTINNVTIKEYSAGTGLKISGVNYWCEGTTLLNVAFKYNKTNILFSASAPSTGSFAYTRFLNVSINMGDSQIGIDFGGPANNLPSGSLLYHAFLNVIIWLDGGNNATLIKIRDNIKLIDNDYFITGEYYPGGGTNNIGLDIAATSSLYGKGMIDLWGTLTNNLLGQVRFLSFDSKSIDNVSGTDTSSNIYKSMLTGDVIDYSNTAMGFYYNGGSIQSPFVACKNHAGNGFTLLSVDDANQIKDGKKVFRVDQTGTIYPNLATGGSGILSGLGSPLNVVYAPKGSIYLRFDGSIGNFIYINDGDIGRSDLWKTLQQELNGSSPMILSGSGTPTMSGIVGSIYTQIVDAATTHIWVCHGGTSWTQQV